jgi:hypothetical protein
MLESRFIDELFCGLETPLHPDHVEGLPLFDPNLDHAPAFDKSVAQVLF